MAGDGGGSSPWAGTRALVAGGTDGIGRGIAELLASRGASVTVSGTSAERGAAVVAACRAASPPGSGASFAFERVDGRLLSSCKDLASRVEGALAGAPLDVLVLTHSYATFKPFTPTAEGLDEKLALNYWSRAQLAVSLSGAMARAENPRVLSVLSAGVHAPHKNYATDPELKAGFGLKAAADTAGFYNDIAAEKLAETYPKVAFFHAAPGFVNTSWGTGLPTPARLLMRCLQPLGRSPQACAARMVGGMEGRGAGWYLLDQEGKPTPKPTRLHDEAKAFVWAHTLKVLEACGTAC